MQREVCVGLASLLLLVACPAVLAATEVEFRLVPYDQLDVTLDALESAIPVPAFAGGLPGGAVEGPRIEQVTWVRGVRLNNEPLFERYTRDERGEPRYIARHPVARRELEPGAYTIWPGNHVFTVGDDGELGTASPHLEVSPGLVRIPCYPLRLHAYYANSPEADQPPSSRRVPLPGLTVRDAAQAAAAREPVELLPVFESVFDLTLYLPAHADGAGYRLHPVGTTFHLGAAGVVAGAGDGDVAPGMDIEGFAIRVPMFAYPAAGLARGAMTVDGYAGNQDDPESGLVELSPGVLKWLHFPPRTEPYRFRVGNVGPSVTIDSDTAALPVKRMTAVSTEGSTGAQRGLVLELPGRLLRLGDPFRFRLSAIDTAHGAAQAFIVRQHEQRLQALRREQRSFRDRERALDARARAGEVDEADRARLAADKQALEEALAAAEAALKEAREAFAEADVNANALDGAPRIVRLRRAGGTEPWRQLEDIVREDDGWLTVRIPADLPEGLYRLRAGVEVHAPIHPFHLDEWVAVGRERAVGLGVFTPRGRDTFQRGESFWLALGITAVDTELPAGLTAEISLRDAWGRTIPVLQAVTVRPIRAVETLTADLPADWTRRLAPGLYTLDARIGEHQAPPRTLAIVDGEPRSHFGMVYNPRYSNLQDWHRLPAESEGLAAGLAAIGFNGMLGASLAVDRVVRENQEIERIYREHPGLGPWQVLFQPSGRDRFLNAALRNGLGFWETAFGYSDTGLPQGERMLLPAERYVMLETQALRGHPAFRGINLFNNFGSGDSMTPQWVTRLWSQAQELSYRERYPDLTPGRAGEALNRFLSRPRGQRRFEDLEMYRSWSRHLDRQWGQFTDRMAAPVRRLAPGAQVMAVQRFGAAPGEGIVGGAPAPSLFGGLDIAAPLAPKYLGEGDRSVFAGLAGSVLRAHDGLSVWTQIHAPGVEGRYGSHLLRSVFLALAQGVDGILFMEVGRNPLRSDGHDLHDTLGDVSRHLLQPYGDLFRALEPGYRRVAIHYSRDAHALGDRKPNRLTHQVEGLWVACLRAGFPAEILYDHQITAGEGMRYDVIFAPGFTFEEEAPPAVLEALQRLVHAGRTVIVERSSRLPIDGVVRLDSEWDELDDRLGGTDSFFRDFEHAVMLDMTAPLVEIVRGALAGRIPPAAEHDLPVGPNWRRHGKGDYLIVPNFSEVGFRGLHRTMHVAPALAHLRFPVRPPAVYDMLEMRPVEVATEADGEWMRLTADMRAVPGKIYAFLPSPIAGVRIELPDTIHGGRPLHARIAVVDAGGSPIEAAFPLDITLTTADGTVLRDVHRVADPLYEDRYVLPGSVPDERLVLRVRERISGTWAEVDLTLVPSPLQAVGPDTRVVRVRDPAATRAFLPRAPDPESPPVQIVLDSAQAHRRALAESLREGLLARGYKAELVPLSGHVVPPNPWAHDRDARMAGGGTLDDHRLWRGDLVRPGMRIDAPALLIGSRGEHAMIDMLAARDLFPEVPTNLFPGPGKALIETVFRAFSVHHDALAIVGSDSDGLAQGVAHFLAMLDAPEAPEAAEAAAVPALPPVRPREDRSGHRPESFSAQAAGDAMVRVLATDAAGERTLVGTFGYGHNLYCLGPDGAPLWKVHLPEHDVYTAIWIDGDRRVAAATGYGARLFLLDGTDGRILGSYASTEWPDYRRGEGEVSTQVQIADNPTRKQLLVLGRTGLLALDYEGNRLWFHDRARAMVDYPPDWEQTGADAFGGKAYVHNFAVSPDGSRIAVSETRIMGTADDFHGGTLDAVGHCPAVLDAQTGAVLYEHIDTHGVTASHRVWRVLWPADSEHALAFKTDSRAVAPLYPDGTLGTFVLRDQGLAWTGGDRIVQEADLTVRLDPHGRVRWRVEEDDQRWVAGGDAASPDRTRLYRQDRTGLIRCLDAESGATLWEARAPRFSLLHPLPDGLVAGAGNGFVLRFDQAGQERWRRDLRALAEPDATDYAAYVQAASERLPDTFEGLYPVNTDAAGDLDGILRMGIEQLRGTGFEPEAGWTLAGGAEPDRRADAREAGRHALALAAGQRVTQDLDRRIVPSATYLLEFHYRIEDAGASVVAGGLPAGAAGPLLTASVYGGDPADGWRFGRLAIKTPPDPEGMSVGFEAEGGAVLIDAPSLRVVRFPSSNLLAYEPLYGVEPTFVKDFRVQYERVPGSILNDLLYRNHLTAFRQGGGGHAMIWLEAPAFLQNARLDDVGPRWLFAPTQIGVSAALQTPSWISHIVLYFNNADPAGAYRQVSIVANDLDIREPRTVALLRGNRRRFAVIHLDPPIYTDAFKILPGPHPPHRQSLTEIEVYGPLGGPEGEDVQPFADPPEDHPTLLGTATRAMSRLGPELAGTYRMRAERQHARLHVGYPSFPSGLTLAGDLVTWGDAHGYIRSLRALPGGLDPVDPSTLDRAAQRARSGAWQRFMVQSGPEWDLLGATPLGTPTRYRQRLLVGASDHRVHAVADNGTRLWAFRTGGRVYGSPAVQGDSVYFGSMDGSLYCVDFDSGVLLWEYEAGGAIRGSVALSGDTVFAVSADGALHAVHAERGVRRWRTAMAEQSRSTPAVADGLVFAGDENGTLHAFDRRRGRVRWSHALPDRVSTAPVVIPGDGVVVAGDAGAVVRLGQDGAVRWETQLQLRINGQPMATATQWLAPTAGGVTVLRLEDGRPDAGLELEGAPARPALSLVAAGERLAVLYAWAEWEQHGEARFIRYGMMPTLWEPSSSRLPQQAGGE